jgi:uncharacterized protein (TIGR02598 family)
MPVKPHQGLRPFRVGIAAFSLVEVVVAMGVVTFALIVLLGLLPVGLKSNNDSLGESQAVNLIQALIADRQSTAYATNSSIYNLPALTNVSTQTSGQLYVMEDAVTTNALPTLARYRVTYTVYRKDALYAGNTNCPISGPLMPVLINFSVSWPAAQTAPTSKVETTATFMQP